MHTQIRHVGLRETAVAEGPPLALSLVLAELFYKFHSFTLECLAFLVTWFAFSYVVAQVRSALSPRQSDARDRVVVESR